MRGVITFHKMVIFTFIIMIMLHLYLLNNESNADVSSTYHGSTEAQISLFDEMIAKFKKDVGRSPTQQEGLEALRYRPEGVKQWNGPYINKNIPLDYWGNPYTYFYPAKYSNQDYDLYSYGKNMEDDHGDGDDITSWGGYNKWIYERNKQLLAIIIKIIFGIIVGFLGYRVWQKMSKRSGTDIKNRQSKQD